MKMIEDIRRETGVHGTEWNTVHDGYFSDPAVAAPLIEKVGHAIQSSKPDVILDLGGGTGFLLRELIRSNIASGIQLVNLDLSPKQLEMVSDKQIRTVQRSLTNFVRADAGTAGSRFLFMMRSVLHYYGKDGLDLVLRHLRSQMQNGEVFIHQTACFEQQWDADCMNLLYERMQTGKWYPMLDPFRQSLEKAGWTVKNVSPAPPLSLTSRDLGKRYGIDPARLDDIRSDIVKCVGEKSGVFKLTPDGFLAYLHYKVFVCVADNA